MSKGNENNIGFAFAIRPKFDGKGNISGYDVQSQSRGLPDEMVITIVRTWLRQIEDKYYDRFTGKG